jgi:hypothetical protein
MIHNDKCKNAQRAERAMNGLTFHARQLGPVDHDYETQISDLLTDLLHYCDQIGLNFKEILEISIINYDSEAEHSNEECAVAD